MRLMGLDYGTKTVGVALSDELLMSSQPKETIVRERPDKLRRTLARIEELVEEYDVALIVLGLPLNMDDTAGERAQAALAFRDRVERRCSVPVVMSDERLTTVESDRMLDEMGVKRENRKKVIDQVAASLILSEYMENHRDSIEKLKEEQKKDNEET